MWLVLASKKVGRVVGLVWVVTLGKIIGHVVGFGFFVDRVIWFFVPYCIFVGHRWENDHEKASGGRVIGSEFDTSRKKR